MIIYLNEFFVINNYITYLVIYKKNSIYNNTFIKNIDQKFFITKVINM